MNLLDSIISLSSLVKQLNKNFIAFHNFLDFKKKKLMQQGLAQLQLCS